LIFFPDSASGRFFDHKPNGLGALENHFFSKRKRGILCGALKMLTYWHICSAFYSRPSLIAEKISDF
jgi:hypothetical protein